MIPPNRLITDDVDAEVRRLLKAGADHCPAAAAKDSIWESIARNAGVVGATALTVAAAKAASASTLGTPAANLGAATQLAIAGAKSAAGVASAASTVSVGLGAVALKGMAIGLSLGVAILVGGTAVKSRLESQDATSASAPVAARFQGPAQHHIGTAPALPDTATAVARTEPTEQTTAPVGAVVEPQPLAVGAATAAAYGVATKNDVSRNLQRQPEVASVSSAKPALTPDTDALRTESRLVSLARNALHQDRAADTLSILQEIDQGQPSGLLDEERSVLRIEALSRLGRQAEAERLAAQFLSRYPASLHGKRVRELIGSALSVRP